MDRFVLTGDLLTHVSDIDAQHRTLLEFANQAVDPATIDRGAEYFLNVFSFLAGYVDYHFAAEEFLMREVHYPRYEPHHHWHDTFRAEVAQLIEMAKAAGVSKSLKLKVSFAIEDWVLGHIRVNDRELAEYLVRQSGLHVIQLPDAQTLKSAGVVPKYFDERLVKAWSISQ